ncbi:MAG: hypothetical protein KatS3mg002_0272 [Candidatus Woesearchaeota archaeon]|nr:MAG: hypothetical protein KatS3mg002_0272 [Candidatus Woesearchaeota archaeon]
MKYSFAALSQNLWSRKFGGTTVGVANPYVSGYHFIWFANLPRLLYAYVQQGNSGISSNGEIQNILAAACMSVTPPGGTLNKIDFTGLGGSKWAVPGNVDYGDSVSIKFLEFENTPILDIFHGWIKMIRDYRTGATDLIAGSEGDGYTKKTYAGFLYYWTTAPDGLTVQYYAAYDGVFPLKDPQDTFSSDVESVGRVDIEIDFHVDYIWHEPWVKDKCTSLAQSMFRNSRDLVRTYGQTAAGA